MSYVEQLAALRRELAVAEFGEPWDVWTDGSCVYEEGAEKGGLGYGGWAALVEHEPTSFGAFERGQSRRATNVLMELAAAVEGLRLVPDRAFAVVHTDSTELVSVYHTWLAGAATLRQRHDAARRRRHARQWVALAAQYARLGSVEFDLIGKGPRDNRHKRVHLAAGAEAKKARDAALQELDLRLGGSVADVA